MNGKQKLSWLIVLSVCAAVSGCADDATSGPKGGQIGGVTDVIDPPDTSPPSSCEGGDRHEIGESDVSSIGFAAADVLSALSGAHTVPLTWAKGGSTTASLTVGEPTAVSLFTAPDDPACDRLFIDVPLAFSTEDGSFNESIAGTLYVAEAGKASINHEFDRSVLSGSYRITTEVDVSAWDEVLQGVLLHIDLDGSAMAGGLSGHATNHVTGTEPEGTLADTDFNIAFFE